MAFALFPRFNQQTTRTFFERWTGAQSGYRPRSRTRACSAGNPIGGDPLDAGERLFSVALLTSTDIYGGTNFKIECPTGSATSGTSRSQQGNLNRLTRLYCATRMADDPVYGSTEKPRTIRSGDDNIYVYEYFNGSNGAGRAPSPERLVDRTRGQTNRDFTASRGKRSWNRQTNCIHGNAFEVPYGQSEGGGS